MIATVSNTEDPVELPLEPGHFSIVVSGAGGADAYGSFDFDIEVIE